MLEALKNCPFCDATDSDDNVCQEPGVICLEVPTAVGARGWQVVCRCGASSPKQLTAAEAIAAWNRRAYLEAVGGEPVAMQWRKRDRVMKHEEVWSFVDYHTGLKIAEHPEKYETRPLYATPQAPAVRVKRLEWWTASAGDIIADSLVGRYRLGKVTANKNYRLETPSGLIEKPSPHYYWPEAEAKAAAFADYEQRIRSALEAETGGGEAAYDPCGGCGNADPDNRCLGCLHPFVATPTDERVVEALREAEETLQLVEHPSFPDPVHHDEVKRLGRRIGFGALMSTASAAWREELAKDGGPVGGEFVAGPCHSMVVRALGIIRAALAQGESRNG